MSTKSEAATAAVVVALSPMIAPMVAATAVLSWVEGGLASSRKARQDEIDGRLTRAQAKRDRELSTARDVWHKQMDALDAQFEAGAVSEDAYEAAWDELLERWR